MNANRSQVMRSRSFGKLKGPALGLSAAVLCALPSAAMATCAPIQCSGLIQAMSISDTAVYIQLVGGTTGLTNCTPYGGSYITLPKSNASFNTYYATLLAAYMAKEQVTLRTVDGSANCALSYIAIPS